MEKTSKNYIAIGIVLLVAVGVGLWGRGVIVSYQIHATPVAAAVVQKDSLSYKGENGKDALTLLKDHATVVLDSSGMVSGINGRVADGKKHEYWAFLINAKMAQVGAADYQTKTGDVIQWKIETY